MAKAFNYRKIPTVYTGSVKNLRAITRPTDKKPGRYLFEYTDAYSVFDYGRMPDTLAGKGAAMAVGTAFFFEKLEDPKTWQALARSKAWDKIRDPEVRDRLKKSPSFKALKKSGLPTHYKGLVTAAGKRVKTASLTDATHLMEVSSVPILHPEGVDYAGRRLYNYNAIHSGLSSFLVPLECIFRFGIPQGSSLIDRLAKHPGYHAELGLARRPKAGAWLPFPIVELFSKLEPGDRFLRPESALNFSGLAGPEFLSIYDLTSLVAVYLLDLFAGHGVTLWDGKFEFLKLGGKLALGDAITPDELRLTYKKIQISKEPLRQYYKRYDPRFVQAMDEAKKISAKTGEGLKKILKTRLKVAPARLDPEFLAAAASMYPALTAKVTGLDVFGQPLTLDEVVKVFRKFRVA